MAVIEAKKKKCTGRKKIEIKRIEKEESRQVCFSKRRKGLFKKANELHILCGAEVAILMSSLAGKPYTFGQPSVEHVLRRFIGAPTDSNDMFPTCTSCSEQLRQELAYLRENMKVEMGRRDALEKALKGSWSKPFWWNSDVSLMGIEELQDYRKVLRQYQDMVAEAGHQSLFQEPQQSFFEQPQENFFKEPQQSFFEEPQQSFFQEPHQSFFEEPQENFFQEPQQSFIQAPEATMKGFDGSDLVLGGEAILGMDGSDLIPGGGGEAMRGMDSSDLIPYGGGEVMWGMDDFDIVSGGGGGDNYFL